jgi:hypothetical protein
MPEYRIYTMSNDNKIAGPPRLVTCSDDQEAIGLAKQLLDGRDVELWQGARVVTRLRHADGK